MMLYLRISTFSRSARLCAAALGRTWNPTIRALEAEASRTSPSLMAPAAAWMTSSFTSEVDSLWREDFSASTEPATSALMMTFSSWIWPSLICS